MLYFWATVTSNGSPYAIRPLSCQYPVCNIDVLWPYGGWIKMPFGTEIGLGPGNIVLDGDPAPPPPQKGAQQPAIFAVYRCRL